MVFFTSFSRLHGLQKKLFINVQHHISDLHHLFSDTVTNDIDMMSGKLWY